MFSSTFSLLRGVIISTLLLSSSGALFAQGTRFENYVLEPVLVNMSITKINGRKAVRVARVQPPKRPICLHSCDSTTPIISPIGPLK